MSPHAFPPPSPRAAVMAVPAGWYGDPWTADGVRWWDGKAWTYHTADVAAVTTVRPVAPTLPFGAAVGAVLLTIVALIGSRIVLDTLGRFRFPVILYVALAAVLGYLPMILFFWWATRRWGSGSIREDLGFRFQWSDTGWGPLVWLAAVGAEIAMAALIMAFDVPLRGNTESIDDLSGERGVLIALLITAVLVAPFVEELMFRGVLLRGLSSRMPQSFAIVVQAVLFGAAHFDPIRGVGNVGLLLMLSAVGIVLGRAASSFARLGPTIIAHAILNSVAMIAALYVR